jgi:hypothetical protein
MKSQLLILYATWLIPLYSVAQSDSAISARLYGIKSCRIAYKFENGSQHGTKIVTFDRWGAIEKEEVTTTTDTALMRKTMTSAPPAANKISIPTVQHILVIKDAKSKTTIDLDKRMGFVDCNIGPWIGVDFNDKNSSVVGKDTIAGKPCIVREMQHAFRVWLWNKIVLKKQLIQNGPPINVTEYATEIDDAYVTKPREFAIPPDIKMH